MEEKRVVSTKQLCLILPLFLTIGFLFINFLSTDDFSKPIKNKYFESQNNTASSNSIENETSILTELTPSDKINATKPIEPCDSYWYFYAKTNPMTARNTLPFDKSLSLTDEKLHKIKQLLVKPVDGKKMKVVLCTVVRQELNLKEYLVRNYLLGFQHIYVYDNNRIRWKVDYDISEVMAPFVKMGVATHIPYAQDKEGAVNETEKEFFQSDCYQQNLNKSEWITFLDSDEYIYFTQLAEKATIQENNIWFLPQYLDTLEPNICQVVVLWSQLHSEYYWMKPNITLWETYNYFREWHNHKPIMKVGFLDLKSHPYHPHDKVCSRGTAHHPSIDNIVLVHYYKRSMEEWLAKKERSIIPFLIETQPYYAEPPVESLRPFPKDPFYEERFYDLMNMLRMVPDEGKLLGEWTFEESQNITLHRDYEYYKFLKDRIRNGEDLDIDFIKRNYYPENQFLENCRKGLISPMHFWLIKAWGQNLYSCFRTRNQDLNCYFPRSSGVYHNSTIPYVF